MSDRVLGKEPKDMCISRYTFQGKTYMEVAVHKRDKDKKIKKRKSRFTSAGTRINSYKAAEKVKERLRRELDEIIGRKTSYTWKGWQKKAIEDMRRDGFKEGTLERYGGLLNRWIDPSWDERCLGTFTRDDIYDLIHGHLDYKMATQWTKHNVYKTVRRLFEMATEYGEISRNPARGVKVQLPTKEGVALTPKEVDILLQKAKALNHEYYPHWVLALMTGMRNGELYALRWSNIDFDAGVIHITNQFTSKDGIHSPKRGKGRPIDLSPSLLSFLKEIKLKYGMIRHKLWSWREEVEIIDEVKYGRLTGRRVPKRTRVKDYVVWEDLVLPKPRSWRQGAQAHVLREFCRQIGIREVKFHDLRATHITNLLSNGVAISKVMKQVGHSRMSTTDAYHRLTGVAVKGVTESLDFQIPNSENSPDDVVVPLFSEKQE